MSEPTDREYELEKELWDVMTILQQIKMANATNDNKAWQKWWHLATERVRRWMINPTWYLQHPKWQEADEQRT